MKLSNIAAIGIWLFFLATCSGLFAADWPQWRYDAYRSADSPEKLPDQLVLQWIREYSSRSSAWEDTLNQDLMSFDRVFEPVVLGNRLFIGFNDRDKVTALDVLTGEELWTFYTEGPVRLPPVAWEAKVYFVSDDGHLYCVRAETGQQLWKYRGGPSSRKVLGNGRVISAWPARGGPVIRDGVVYFAASIWPFMGTFIYALDAQTGAVRWINDNTGAQYMKQPHGAPSFAGVAPQGAFTATADLLLVPGGRSVPAAFDRHTGKFLYFQLDDGGKGNGGSLVLANESEFFVHTRLRGTRAFDLKTGKKKEFLINEPVLSSKGLYSSQEHSQLKVIEIEAEQKLIASKQSVADAKLQIESSREESDAEAYKKATNALATALKSVKNNEVALAKARSNLGTNWIGSVIQARDKDHKLLWELKVDGSGELIKAGNRLYCALTNSIIAVELPSAGKEASLVWSVKVDGRVVRLIAARGRLFAVTLDGRIMAFGGKTYQPREIRETLVSSSPTDKSKIRAASILKESNMPGGYLLWCGLDDPELLEAVLEQSDLIAVGIDPDADRVEQLRRYFDARGVYGKRLSLHVSDPLQFKAPPYIASMVWVGGSMASQLADSAVARAIYQSVRPYGGTMWVSANAEDADRAVQHLHAAMLAKARISLKESGVKVEREGALPGAADWTHQYGDVANTVKSNDQLVKLPLGLLWFGGNSHADVLPRHGHGPTEQVVGGRLFIEGMSCISARDVYTGRVLWKTDFGDLGTFNVYYDATYTNTPLSTAYNQKHIAGANARGANFIAAEDGVYVVVSNLCHVLDVTQGHITNTFILPQDPDETVPEPWGYVGVYDKYLLAGVGFADYSHRLPFAATNVISQGIARLVDKSASRRLLVLDRYTGRMLWKVDASYSFPHNAIVAGNGRVYCVDKLPQSVTDKWKRRGRSAPNDYRLAAYDVQSGQLLWQTTTDVFGSWLSYSETQDVLLQAGASATDRLKDEAEKGMIAYQGDNGAILWRNLDLKYTGPCILHNDTILTTPTSYKTNAGAFNLLNGAPRLVVNPLTGQSEPMRIYRTYGCNYPVACEHLMTFRSGAAGFYDLETHSGTGNFGGFKSGCSPNLIAANGVLNAPDYTRTCSCPYQNQTSLALVHTPELEQELEIWTHHQFGTAGKTPIRIERLGINFGAPGNRLSEQGTLWMDYPNTSGSLSNISVVVNGPHTNIFRHHLTQVSGVEPKWVTASGIEGAEMIFITPTIVRSASKAATKKTATSDSTKMDQEEYSRPQEVSRNGSGSEENGTNAVDIVNRAGRLWSESVPYTIRLYFMEPNHVRPEERIFDVQLQGRVVLRNFDIAATAGGRLRGIVKEFGNVMVQDRLMISFNSPLKQKLSAILCGVEMIRETNTSAARPSRSSTR